MDNTNAETEFLEHTNGADILCAEVTTGRDYYDDCDRRRFVLRAGYSKAELEHFLQSLDFEYDSGYGGQELDGYIWYKDGTWSERYEYDGLEWWSHKVCPPIPKECAPKNDVEA